MVFIQVGQSVIAAQYHIIGTAIDQNIENSVSCRGIDHIKAGLGVMIDVIAITATLRACPAIADQIINVVHWKTVLAMLENHDIVKGEWRTIGVNAVAFLGEIGTCDDVNLTLTQHLDRS